MADPYPNRDCRLADIVGLETENLVARELLNVVPSTEPAIALISMQTRPYLFARANFRLSEKDEYDWKFVRTLEQIIDADLFAGLAEGRLGDGMETFPKRAIKHVIIGETWLFEQIRRDPAFEKQRGVLKHARRVSPGGAWAYEGSASVVAPPQHPNGVAPAQRHHGERLGDVWDVEVLRAYSGRVIGRKAELEATVQALGDRGVRSVVLVGESGVGKTAVIRAALRQLVESATDTWVIRTSSSELEGLGHFAGQVEEIVEGVLAGLRGTTPLIYIDDIEMLFTVGTYTGKPRSVAHHLQPFLERGEIRLLGECSAREYDFAFSSQPSFLRLIQRIDIEPATEQQALDLLRARSDGQEWSEDALARAIDLSRWYRPGEVLPGRVIRLVEDMEREGAAMEARPLAVSATDVAEHVAVQASIRPSLLAPASANTEVEMRRHFEDKIFGQPEAVEAFVDLLLLVNADLTPEGRPRGSVFLTGPTGVGKTALAQALAAFVFSNPGHLVRFDMTEFSGPTGVTKLLGDPYDREGTGLRNGAIIPKIYERPQAVILFDEIEKAESVWPLLLQVLDEGRLTNAAGRSASFEGAIIVFTSNALVDEAGRGTDDETLRQRLQEKVGFPPELVNRFDRVLLLRDLDIDARRRIVEREVRRAANRSGLTRRGIRLKWESDLIEYLTQAGWSKQYGARPLRRVVERVVLGSLSRHLARSTSVPQELTLVVERERVSESGRVWTDAGHVRVVG